MTAGQVRVRPPAPCRESGNRLLATPSQLANTIEREPRNLSSTPNKRKAVRQPRANCPIDDQLRCCAEYISRQRRRWNGGEIPTSYGRAYDFVSRRNRYRESGTQRTGDLQETEGFPVQEGLHSISSSVGWQCGDLESEYARTRPVGRS